MKLSKYIHSCILLEEGDDSLLIDPGMFTFMDESITPDQFGTVKTILITHNHPDHIDVDALKKILELSTAVVLTTPEIKEALSSKGIEGDIRMDTEYMSGAFSVKAIPAMHEAILSDSLPTNYGYVINGRILHPGDSFAESLTGTGADVLLLPITAPWTTELGVFEFAKRADPKTIIPIHDGYVKDFFLESRYKNYAMHFEPLGIDFKPLVKPGDSVTL